MEWMPIETAPHGLKILVGYRNSFGHWRNVTAIYYDVNRLPMEETHLDEDDEFAPAGWYETSDTHETIHATEHPPTHWMPLPLPPTGRRTPEQAE